MPKITVCVTTYDRTDLLVATIRSVLNQSFQDFELLVGNDNPRRVLTGESFNIYDDRITWINNSVQYGYVENYNKLLQMAKGEFFVSLSDDDLFHSKFLEFTYNSSLIYNLDVVYTAYQSSDPNFKHIEEFYSPIDIYGTSDWIVVLLKRIVKVQGCYALVKTNLLKKIGGGKSLGTNSSFSPGNDLLQSIELSCLSNIGYSKIEYIYYRLHEDSISCSSTDVSAYLTAQIDFVAHFASSIKNYNLNSHKLGLLLLNVFVSDYFHVIQRSRPVEFNDFLTFVKTHFKSDIMVSARLCIALDLVSKFFELCLYANLKKIARRAFK